MMTPPLSLTSLQVALAGRIEAAALLAVLLRETSRTMGPVLFFHAPPPRPLVLTPPAPPAAAGAAGAADAAPDLFWDFDSITEARALAAADPSSSGR